MSDQSKSDLGVRESSRFWYRWISVDAVCGETKACLDSSSEGEIILLSEEAGKVVAVLGVEWRDCNRSRICAIPSLGALSVFLVTELKILLALDKNMDEADTVVPGGRSPPPASDVIVIDY